MYPVLILGAGKIGSTIACLLAQSGDYDVHLADKHFEGDDVKRLCEAIPSIKTVEIDVKKENTITDFVKQHPKKAVICSTPYFLNVSIAEAALENGLHYFDLTEDISVTTRVKQLAENSRTVFVPQCGLAPGFINIAANSLMQRFDMVESTRLRVGALPENVDNALHYSLTWSTDGVINEYGNPCHSVVDGNHTVVHPLEDLEKIQCDGLMYEAFNTSGGLGSLAELYAGKVKNLNYKTIRYPGHCEKMRFLMNDLKLNYDRDTLKRILENAIPKTYQDVVLVYVSVTGYRDGVYVEENYFRKIYPHTIAGLRWSAIQITTAAGICAVVDKVLSSTNEFHGLVLQEQFALDEFLKNRFGCYYAVHEKE